MEQSQSCLQNLQSLEHKCNINSPRDLEFGKNWLMILLNSNGIDINELLQNTINVVDKKSTKVNTLSFLGETNTGKMMLTNLNKSHLTVGTINRRGDQSQFHFDNLLNRTFGIMEEPRITNATKNALLGGDRFEIGLKYGSKEFLERIPIIAAMNEDLDVPLHHIDRNALLALLDYVNAIC
ncbi:unnamed protein product [Hymenolepis diminuta]|uniref:Parvovirus non-structural protein 1 helicase domain-containing protein n=1 Tax=Hymenolepis diminuta TaxID=6216 RepID=A0A564Y2X9_HYMDI|nr:unnamed protein product [Hymenolepis diminuta]